MEVGQVWKDGVFEYKDSYSGRWIKQLTNYKGHSRPLYFTDRYWTEDGKSFVFASDREGHSNLFRYDLPTEEIVQMTAFTGKGSPTGFYSLANKAHYFLYDNGIYEVKIDSLKQRKIYEFEGEFVPRCDITLRRDGTYEIISKSTLNVSCDGKFVCTMVQHWDDVKPTGDPTIYYSYSRHAEMRLKKPLTRIIKVEIETGKATVVHEDRCHMGHINNCPTNPDILTFCHEGPWKIVDQRMWGLNIKTGEVWKIRPQDGTVSVGHEYWFADGETLGYHGRMRENENKQFYGAIKWDGTMQEEYDFPFQSTHFHSLDFNLIVGDGSAFMKHHVYGDYARPYIMLFKKVGDKFVGPKLLAFHRSSLNDQHAHPHPQITPDGKNIIYSSDLTNYSNIFMVEIGDFDSLPDVPSLD